MKKRTRTNQILEALEDRKGWSLLTYSGDKNILRIVSDTNVMFYIVLRAWPFMTCWREGNTDKCIHCVDVKKIFEFIDNCLYIK